MGEDEKECSTILKSNLRILNGLILIGGSEICSNMLSVDSSYMIGDTIQHPYPSATWGTFLHMGSELDLSSIAYDLRFGPLNYRLSWASVE